MLGDDFQIFRGVSAQFPHKMSIISELYPSYPSSSRL